MENLLEKMDRKWEPAIVGQTLRGAADRLERVGWCQNTAQNEARNECASQAIVMVAGEIASANPALREFAHPGCANEGMCSLVTSYLSNDVSRLLARYLEQPYVVYWNDMPGRTATEVTDALRTCADHVDPPK